jgi:ligand-binding SRPBCC domain-containing protein
MSSAIDVENISVSTFPEKKTPVQNLTPIISVTIIARLAWIICFYAEIAAGTEQEEAVFPFSIISVKNVKIDKAMSNVKAQGSNKGQIPNLMVS